MPTQEPEEGGAMLNNNDRENIKEGKEQLRHLQKEAFQLANYYFVFQGVIFTASYAAPSDLKCRYNWVPFTLSLCAGLLNFCALLIIACKYTSKLGIIEKDFAAHPLHEESNRAWCNRHLRCCCVCLSMSIFFVFFVVTLVGSLLINCSSEQQAKSPPPST